MRDNKYTDIYEEMKKDEVNESDLARFTAPKYKDYEHGDPQKAAKFLMQKLDALKKDLAKAESMAGEFLAPGMKASFKKDLDSILK
jgi:hypothetical protein